jgi:uncharacterized phage protein gp47/JayE
MIDPGHPFTRPFADLIDALEESVRVGVEQPAQDRFIFQSSQPGYTLRLPASSITRVSGLVGGKTFTVFKPGVHYRLSGNRIIWLDAPEKPLEGGRLEVQYTYRERPAGLTDFNPGSVIGTLVRAVARELTAMYGQMDEAYRRAFIDQATGVALDNVVALLGVRRHPDLAASGAVTFFRKTATNNNIPIPVNTRVADESGRVFATTAAAQIEPVVTETAALAGDRVQVKNQIAEIEGIWPRTGTTDPTSGDPLVIRQTAGLAIGNDQRTILLGGIPPSVLTALAATGEVVVRYKSKSVTVPVQAAAPGPNGNVNSGAVIIMPTPPTGVDGVVNEAPIGGGQSAEPDDQLRERAKHALERSGNATLNAIKFAVLDVDGVDGVEVADHSADGTIPLGEVRVRYSSGDEAAVQARVESTRAAGILARLERINRVLISGRFILIPDATPSAAAPNAFVSAAVDAINALGIGQALSLRRLNALAYQVSGLAEAAEAQLRFKKDDPNTPGETIEGDVSDPLLAERTEQIRADAGQLRAVVLAGLAAQRRAGTKLSIEIWLKDAANNEIHFGQFSIDVSITLRAFLANAPDQPADVVGRFTTTVTFNDQTRVVLTIDPATQAPQLRRTGPDPHDLTRPGPVTINASAYPGLQPATDATVDFSV